MENFHQFYRSSRLPLALLAAALNACAGETALLNSERIEQEFGSYGIDILASDAGLRRSNLYSVTGTDRICRTYAVVRFTGEVDDSVSREHAKVLEGNSLGEVFKSNGWEIHKQTLHIGSFGVRSADTEILNLMHLSGDQSLALHIYQLSLVKDGDSFEYATILEAHHPDYLVEKELLEIYPHDHTDSLAAAPLAELVSLLTARNLSP